MNGTRNVSLIRCVIAPLMDNDGGFKSGIISRMKDNFSVCSDLSDALMFTVRSVVKIVQQVPAP